MKFTRKDLADATGLKIGDKVKFNNGEIAKVTENYYLDFYPEKACLSVIIDEEIEILPQKKKVGEKLCKDLGCKLCPLFGLNCHVSNTSTLYDVLTRWYVEHNNKEVYDILKVRLDMEEE